MISCEKIPFRDKGCHFIVGSILSIIFIFIFTPLVTLLLITIIAVLKEEYDKYIKKTFIDSYDIIATMLGSLPILIVNYIINSM